jgi:arylsulfatase A-like enzyme
VPENTQSISFVPTLVGDVEAQENHKYLYWEFYERGGKQAVRFGKWKAIRIPMHTGEVALYDLSSDLAELFDVAGAHPEVVARAKKFMDEAHEPNPNWVAGGKKKPAPKGKK